jgi:CO dehydrogenase/acetyl-CoA synthase gamma subunit (corrinoid Fe-S protein)
MAISRDKETRLTSRLERVRAFIEYLQEEEAREKTEFLLSDNEEIMPAVVAAFEEEKPLVLASAKKNLAKAAQLHGQNDY